MSHPRRHPPEALALYAAYRDRREPYRPLECHHPTGGSPCWVEDGPPSMTTAGHGNRCTGCGAPPRPIGRRAGRER